PLAVRNSGGLLARFPKYVLMWLRCLYFVNHRIDASEQFRNHALQDLAAIHECKELLAEGHKLVMCSRRYALVSGSDFDSEVSKHGAHTLIVIFFGRERWKLSRERFARL